MRLLFCLLAGFAFINPSIAQLDFYKSHTFTRADTLRGMLRPERTAYDVTYYDLSINVDIPGKSLAGSNKIYYRALQDFDRLQIDLAYNMSIDSIVFAGQPLEFERQYNAVFIDFPEQLAASQGYFEVFYHGQPLESTNPPWEDGFVWAEDKEGNPWVGVACEGGGASIWWPNKDHLSDEPDSMMIRVTVPDSLMCVANGNMRGKFYMGDGQTRYNWFVSYPINNYNASINIAKYAHFFFPYTNLEGEEMMCDFYVLPQNLDKAKEHFQQVPGVLACFERYFGKYPFWEDGYALVEVPYLGMEHQSAIAYGNQYMKGYLGGRLPGNMDWDYIIVHETGHEYWGNSVSCNDLAELWIHESFTTYMEALYVECAYGYDEALEYLNLQKLYIENKEPMLGPPNVNWNDFQATDIYYKGSWMLHTLRNALDNDEMWFDILRSFYQKHALGHATTSDFIDYVNNCTKKDFTPFFRQYLEYPSLPIFKYRIIEKEDGILLTYRWEADVPGFHMPLKVGKKGYYTMIHPTREWQTIKIKGVNKFNFRIATELFYVDKEMLRI